MWSRLSKRERFLLLVLLGTAVLFCFFYFIFNPQLNAYSQVKTDLEEQRAKLAQAQNTAASLTTETARLEKVRAEYAEKGRLFNTEMRDGSDIILLGLKSLSGKIVITEIVPAAVKENAHTLELPLNLVAEGDYLNILAFRNDLEKLLKGISDLNLAEIRSMKIEKQESGGQAVDSGLVRASVEFVIYSSKEPQARLQLDAINRWLTGRYNMFREAGPFAPVRELEHHLYVSPANNETQGVSGGAAAGNGNQPPGTGTTGTFPQENSGSANQAQTWPAQFEPGFIQKK
ncbi:MAG: type II secretion system protein GspM [Peptococcaceae bacterium MAG4]|nr:type II secretion system protein GspM [Peptococcaceae bacterium MAG4]